MVATDLRAAATMIDNTRTGQGRQNRQEGLQ